jgi:hypothetical protein
VRLKRLLAGRNGNALSWVGGRSSGAIEALGEINRPVFVVGSPRSGTSILTWCLGQHPNIVPLEESSWMGDLAIYLAIHYQTGTARDDRSLLSAMDVQKGEFFAIFGETINKLILGHRIDLERKRWKRAAPPNTPPDHFVTESTSKPKARWVDGTPEYSFHICGLRKLFPHALFIHIVRDVTSVVRSMLNFHRLGGLGLVANEQEAYDYWFRTVSSCVLAEQAYGPGVVFRVRHPELVDKPEATLRSLLNFLGEPFAAECLTPLQTRINSSNVPTDFKIGDPQTDPRLVEQARQLSRQVEEIPQSPEASPDAVQKIEAAFDKRAQYVAGLGREYGKVLQKIATLQRQNAAATIGPERKNVQHEKPVLTYLRG